MYPIKDDIPVMLIDEATIETVVKILLVRLRLIGDVVFTTPVIRALRRRYPHAHLDYLVEPAAAPIVTGNPHLNEVIVAPKPRGMARLAADVRLARSLRRARYDVVIDLHGGPRSGWLTWASGAPRRIGYDIKGRGWMYTQPRGARARPAAASFGAQPMGPAGAARHRAARPGAGCRRDGRRSARPPPGPTRGCARPASAPAPRWS